MAEGEEEVELEEEEEVKEALAQREGRRRLAGRAGLRKFFRAEEDSLFPCGETDELTRCYHAGLPTKDHTLIYFTWCHVSHL